MTQPITTAAADDRPDPAQPQKPAASGQADPRAPRSRPPQRLLSAEACISKMEALPGLISMSVLTPAQANAIRGTYSTIIDYHYKQQQQSRTAGAPLSDSHVAELKRISPDILNHLAPLLSDEQLAALMREEAEDEAGE